MRRLTGLMALMVIAGCGADEDAEAESLFPDPEVAAVSFLTAHVFDDPSRLRPRFTREVEPAGFPLRNIVDGPAELAFERLWRLRTIDNRYVVEAIVRVRGKPKRVTLWLEVQEGNWRISGWAPEMAEVDPAAPTPSAGADVPVPFAAAAFRGAPSMEVVYFPTRNEAVAPADLPVRAQVQLPTVGVGCPEKALRDVLGKSRDRFAECYADAIGDGRLRPGRMTYSLRIKGQPATIEPGLEETTLIHPGLSECVERVLSNLWIDRSDTCEATVRIIFSPKKRKRKRKRKRR